MGVILASLFPCRASAQIAPDIYLQTTQTFPTWTSNCQPTLVTCDGPGVVCDPVNLLGSDPAFGGFCNQIQANSHAFVTGGNDFYFFSYGDPDLGSLEGAFVGDAIHSTLRVSPGGAYQIGGVGLDACVIPPPPTLAFPNIGIDWERVGWMGVGATIFKPRPSLNFCGFQYFSLVWLADSGPNQVPNRKLADCGWPTSCSNPNDPSTCYGEPGNELTRCDDTFKFAWAMSPNGSDWYFDKTGSGAFCDNSPPQFNTVMTTDPRLAQAVVSRALWYPYSGSNKTDGPFLHIAGFFSDSTLSGQNGAGDDKYYAFTGYEHPCGISAISFRIKIDSAWPTSRGNIELYDRISDNYFPPDYPAPSCGTTCPTPGFCKPTNQSDICNSCQDMTGRVTSVCNPQDPRRLCFPLENECPFFCPTRHQILPRSRYTDVVDVHDVVVLKKADGTFHSLLMAYESGDTFLTGRITVRQSKNIKAPFNWSERRDLEICKLASDGFVDCGAGFLGWPVAFVQPPQATFPSFYDSMTGVPTKILGYFVGRESPTQCGGTDPVFECGRGPQGLIPAVISVVPGPQIPPVTNLKMKKLGSDVQYCWNHSPGISRYRLVQGTLASLQTGAYDHHRFAPSPPQSVDPQQQCDLIFSGTTTHATTASPGTQVPGDSYWIVVPVCNGESEGSYGTSSNGIVRPTATGCCRQGCQALNLTNGACQ